MKYPILDEEFEKKSHDFYARNSKVLDQKVPDLITKAEFLTRITQTISEMDPESDMMILLKILSVYVVKDLLEINEINKSMNQD